MLNYLQMIAKGRAFLMINGKEDMKIIISPKKKPNNVLMKYEFLWLSVNFSISFNKFIKLNLIFDIRRPKKLKIYQI